MSDKLIQLQNQAINNRKVLQKATFGCVCFRCLKTFDFKKIVEFVDRDTTALCPFCKIDTVVPMNVEDHEEILELAKELSENMKK